MLDFGFSEVVVTSMIALVVLGPKRLPGVMRRIGNWMGRARVMARQLSEQLEREINAEEILQQTKKNPPLPPDPRPPEPPAAAATTVTTVTTVTNPVTAPPAVDRSAVDYHADPTKPAP